MVHGCGPGWTQRHRTGLRHVVDLFHPAGFGPALHVQRHCSWVFGYGHMPIFAAIAATGAGLHVAAYFIDHETHIPAAAAVASIAIPVILFKASLTTLYSIMLGRDREQLWGTALVLVGLAASVAMAAAGASVPICMLEMMVVLGLSIAYDERRGHKGRAAALRRLETAAG